ncbi:MAG: ISL3 family transposase, partial [Candidatus Dormibacteria bacterium]
MNILGVEDVQNEALRIHIECVERTQTCRECGSQARIKERPDVELVDLPAFGRPVRLIWHKRRFECSNTTCPVKTWTEENPRIASSRLSMTDRSGRWITEQIGRYARSVNEVAHELGCDWHTINSAVIAYGTVLVDEDPYRIGVVSALGLDETLFFRLGEWHTLQWATCFVDVKEGTLLDLVEGRTSKAPSTWLKKRTTSWKQQIRYGTMDLSGPYQSVFDTELPHVIQVADPFHVIKHANSKLDECRRRVQNATLEHRGRKADPLYRCRRLLTKAKERLDDKGHEKLLGLLKAGDPDGEVATAWQAKEAVRSLYLHTDAKLALEWVETLGTELKGKEKPVEVRSLGRTLIRWKKQIAAWHETQVTNGPTESMNNLVKRVKRGAFGFTNFVNFRVRALLYAGKP